jgi:hypothetical protein
MLFVGQANGKGRFLNVTCLCKSNFATLNPSTEVMQLKRLRGCIIFESLLAIIFYLMEQVYAELYNITRRGQAYVAYPYLGAMRRPDCGDRHGGTNSHVFFISKPIVMWMLNWGVQEAT